MTSPAADGRCDLVDRDDVERLVVAFYEAAFADHLLGPIFVDVAQMDLAAHLPIMCDFWETVLFRAGLYSRNALAVHLQLNAKTPLGRAHFDRWLELWVTTVDRLFAGDHADRATVQAERIASSICRRLAAANPDELTVVPLTAPGARTSATSERTHP